MKICIISNWYKPHAKSGAGIYADNIAKALSERGNEVSVITMLPEYAGRKSLSPQLSVENGIRVYRFHPVMEKRLKARIGKKEVTVPLWYAAELYNPHANWAVKEVLRKEKPDVVHINCLRGLSFSVVGAVKKMGYPVVYTCHDYRLICPLGTLLKRSGRICEKPRAVCRAYSSAAKRTVNGKVDVALAPSRFVMDMHLKEGFFSDAKTHVLPLGVDIKARPQMRKEKKKTDEMRFLYVGQLVKHKGVQVLIAAFRELPQRNARLDIVGDGPYEKELKKLAEGDERIVFHGKKTNEEVGKFYEQADASVVPSIWYDNSPLVIYESFGYGVPVIASRIGGIPELVEEDVNGLLFPPGDIRLLKSRLRDLLENTLQINKMKMNILHRSDEHSMANHVVRLTGVYRSVEKR